MQNWKRLGLIFKPEWQEGEARSHAAVPFITSIKDSIARIFFTARNKDNRSLMSYVDFDLSSLKIAKLSRSPIFLPGNPGFFDEDGVMGCDSLEINDERLMYYIGWNRAAVVPFRNSIGVARIEGERIERSFSGPVLDRSKHDPCFVASCCVIPYKGSYLMYYLSCVNWKLIKGSWRHYYHIKIATSENGLDWSPTGRVAIDFRYSNEYAISVPRVVKEDDLYKMWFSFRGGPSSDKYRIGYAESGDGLSWQRKDEEVSFSGAPGDWESDMACYPYVFSFKSRRYMLYNGNGYGQTGFGLAVLEE